MSLVEFFATTPTEKKQDRWIPINLKDEDVPVDFKSLLFYAIMYDLGVPLPLPLPRPIHSERKTTNDKWTTFAKGCLTRTRTQTSTGGHVERLLHSFCDLLRKEAKSPTLCPSAKHHVHQIMAEWIILNKQ